MKVWWVLGYDRYYPSSDNFIASFSSEEEAEEWVKNVKEDNLNGWAYDNYTVINISSRL